MAHPHPDQSPEPARRYLPDRLPRPAPEWRDPQASIGTDVTADLIDAGQWTGPVVDPDPPAVTAEDLAKVIAARLTGVNFTPSEVWLLAEPDGDRVVLRVITWGPVADEHRRREARYVIELGEPT